MKTLTVLPTSRSIRNNILKLQDSNQFLPSFTTIGEFLQRVVIVEDFYKVDSDVRTLMLLEASDFSSFLSLQIERNFFTFLQNSRYIFRFFEELSTELVDINSLELADTYAEYSEHIEILTHLHARYKKLCFEKKILDPIFLPELYKINSDYIGSFETIKIVIDGYLTNFELKILQECCEICNVVLEFKTSHYNQKMQRKLSFDKLEFTNGYIFEIDLNNKEILTEIKESINFNINCESISQRSLQVAFIKEKVHSFVKSGIEVEKIAVVLPDEEFASYIKEFDDENNFNFAMGISLKESYIYRNIKAITDYLDNQTIQNRDRLNRYDKQLFELISKNYQKNLQDMNFSDLLEKMISVESNRDVKKILLEEIHRFKELVKILATTTLKSSLHLFLNRVSERSIDDTRGGRISVIGLLETRDVAYEGVIVVDFNDSKAPKKSEKDMFLNSSLRAIVGLPTTHEREALQKYYYNSLFSKASNVAICYVDSEQSRASRFLIELGIISTKKYDENSYAQILLEKKPKHSYVESETVEPYDFTTRPLSASALKIFLSCKRKFYYRYIKKINSHEIQKDMPDEWQIGNILHSVLYEVYSKRDSYESKKELREAVLKQLNLQSKNSELEKFQYHLWAKKLEDFFDSEIERFSEGVKVFACEKELKCDFAGLKLTGNIDRIDKTSEDELEVLDYKSGSYTLYTARTLEKAVDFQLEFYYLLVKANYDKRATCAFYDLKSSKIVHESLLEQKLDRLQKILNEIRETKEFSFDMCDDLAQCNYCEFAYLCGKGI